MQNTNHQYEYEQYSNSQSDQEEDQDDGEYIQRHRGSEIVRIAQLSKEKQYQHHQVYNNYFSPDQANSQALSFIAAKREDLELGGFHIDAASSQAEMINSGKKPQISIQNESVEMGANKFGMTQQIKQQRNINNLYYNTNDEEEIKQTDQGYFQGELIIDQVMASQKLSVAEGDLSNTQKMAPQMRQNQKAQLPKTANIISGQYLSSKDNQNLYAQRKNNKNFSKTDQKSDNLEHHNMGRVLSGTNKNQNQQMSNQKTYKISKDQMRTIQDSKKKNLTNPVQGEMHNVVDVGENYIQSKQGRQIYDNTMSANIKNQMGAGQVMQIIPPTTHPYRVIKQNQVKFQKAEATKTAILNQVYQANSQNSHHSSSSNVSMQVLNALDQNQSSLAPPLTKVKNSTTKYTSKILNTDNSLEKMLEVRSREKKQTSNSAMGHFNDQKHDAKNSTMNVYQSQLTYQIQRGPGGKQQQRAANSQLGNYNRIVNIGKLNKISKQNSQKSSDVYSKQGQKHKDQFYQTQVLKKPQGEESQFESTIKVYQNQKIDGDVYRALNNSQQSLQQLTQDKHENIKTGDIINIEVHQQNLRTNSMEDLKIRKNRKINAIKINSKQQKNQLYRPVAGAQNTNINNNIALMENVYGNLNKNSSIQNQHHQQFVVPEIVQSSQQATQNLENIRGVYQEHLPRMQSTSLNQSQDNMMKVSDQKNMTQGFGEINAMVEVESLGSLDKRGGPKSQVNRSNLNETWNNGNMKKNMYVQGKGGQFSTNMKKKTKGQILSLGRASQGKQFFIQKNNEGQVVNQIKLNPNQQNQIYQYGHSEQHSRGVNRQNANSQLSQMSHNSYKSNMSNQVKRGLVNQSKMSKQEQKSILTTNESMAIQSKMSVNEVKKQIVKQYQENNGMNSFYSRKQQSELMNASAPLNIKSIKQNAVENHSKEKFDLPKGARKGMPNNQFQDIYGGQHHTDVNLSQMSEADGNTMSMQSDDDQENENEFYNGQHDQHLDQQIIQQEEPQQEDLQSIKKRYMSMAQQQQSNQIKKSRLKGVIIRRNLNTSHNTKDQIDSTVSTQKTSRLKMISKKEPTSNSVENLRKQQQNTQESQQYTDEINSGSTLVQNNVTNTTENTKRAHVQQEYEAERAQIVRILQEKQTLTNDKDKQQKFVKPRPLSSTGRIGQNQMGQTRQSSNQQQKKSKKLEVDPQAVLFNRLNHQDLTNEQMLELLHMVNYSYSQHTSTFKSKTEMNSANGTFANTMTKGGLPFGNETADQNQMARIFEQEQEINQRRSSKNASKNNNVDRRQILQAQPKIGGQTISSKQTNRYLAQIHASQKEILSKNSADNDLIVGQLIHEKASQGMMENTNQLNFDYEDAIIKASAAKATSKSGSKPVVLNQKVQKNMIIKSSLSKVSKSQQKTGGKFSETQQLHSELVKRGFMASNNLNNTNNLAYNNQVISGERKQASSAMSNTQKLNQQRANWQEMQEEDELIIVDRCFNQIMDTDGHNEYQNFTDQVIEQEKFENMENQQLEDSNEYFKLTSGGVADINASSHLTGQLLFNNNKPIKPPMINNSTLGQYPSTLQGKRLSEHTNIKGVRPQSSAEVDQSQKMAHGQLISGYGFESLANPNNQITTQSMKGSFGTKINLQKAKKTDQKQNQAEAQKPRKRSNSRHSNQRTSTMLQGTGEVTVDNFGKITQLGQTNVSNNMSVTGKKSQTNQTSTMTKSKPKYDTQNPQTQMLRSGQYNSTLKIQNLKTTQANIKGALSNQKRLSVNSQTSQNQRQSQTFGHEINQGRQSAQSNMQQPPLQKGVQKKQITNLINLNNGNKEVAQFQVSKTTTTEAHQINVAETSSQLTTKKYKLSKSTKNANNTVAPNNILNLAQKKNQQNIKNLKIQKEQLQMMNNLLTQYTFKGGQQTQSRGSSSVPQQSSSQVAGGKKATNRVPSRQGKANDQNAAQFNQSGSVPSDKQPDNLQLVNQNTNFNEDLRMNKQANFKSKHLNTQKLQIKDNLKQIAKEQGRLDFDAEYTPGSQKNMPPTIGGRVLMDQKGQTLNPQQIQNQVQNDSISALSKASKISKVSRVSKNSNPAGTKQKAINQNNKLGQSQNININESSRNQGGKGQRQPLAQKQGQKRIASENRYAQQQRLAHVQNDEMINLNSILNQNYQPKQPQSFENTHGNLRNDLQEIAFKSQGQKYNLGCTYAHGGGLGLTQIQEMLRVQNHDSAFQANNVSYNKSSMLGTLKGGLGVMNNISNADFPEGINDSLINNELGLANQNSKGSLGNGAYNFYNSNKTAQGGKILNIENVLNQIHNQRNFSKNPSIENDNEYNQLNQLNQYFSNSQENNQNVFNKDQSGKNTDDQQLIADDYNILDHFDPSEPVEEPDDYDIINIQQTKEFYQVQQFKQYGKRPGVGGNKNVTISDDAYNLQLNKKNSKTQPIPKQVIRAANKAAKEAELNKRQSSGYSEERKNKTMKNEEIHQIQKKLQEDNINIQDQDRPKQLRSASEKSRSISKISRQSKQSKEKQDLAKKIGTKKHNLLINSDVQSNFFSGKNSAAKGSQASKDSKKKDQQVVVKTKNLEINTNKQINDSEQDVYQQADKKKSSFSKGSSEKIMKQIDEINLKNTATIQELGEMPKIGNKKRVEYINQLKEDLEEKIKQRYTNLQQKNTLSQSNNNLILIDHNSAYNPSQVGDNGESHSPSENRVHNYIFGRQIGEGAYAVVRVATSREDNQKYAIKIYDKTKLCDINRQRSVRREVVLLQKMNHENIVKLIEAFETDSHVYLVMENVSGGSLHSYLKEMINKQLDEEEARRIFGQILIALKYCHGMCIAHRDIKLENILLDHDKNVKLIDFGFSTCIPNHKKIRMFCGTPSYMAPQIVSKVEYAGPPADLWATGVLLYALLNGCFPFRGQTDDDLYRRIRRGTYQIYNQKVTREYLDILQRCLDINDDTRPSAKDLLDDPWFSIDDIKQRAYDEEKRQFKAKILAKVPIIKKTNHTICILAQNPAQVGAKIQADQGEKQENDKNNENTNGESPLKDNNQNADTTQIVIDNNPSLKVRKPQGLQNSHLINFNDKQVIQVNQANLSNFPYQNNKDDIIISDYGLNQRIGDDRARDNRNLQINLANTQQANQQVGSGSPLLRENNPPRTLNLNQHHQINILGQNSDGNQNSGSGGATGGAIVLSYGAALAPQIQINNINNLNLINSNMKKKLNHEAYQAYYNTSSTNNNTNQNPAGVMNIQSSPIAGDSSHNPQPRLDMCEQNVYGQANPTITVANRPQPQPASCLMMNQLNQNNQGDRPNLPNSAIIGGTTGTSTQRVPVANSEFAEMFAPESTGMNEAYENQNCLITAIPSTGAPDMGLGAMTGGYDNILPLNDYNNTNRSMGGARNSNPPGNNPIASYNTGTGSRSASINASVQSSPYSSAYHHQIVKNQMAQLHQLQQEQMREKQQQEHPKKALGDSACEDQLVSADQQQVTQQNLTSEGDPVDMILDDN